jgi:ribosomal protein S18 acetylase RimI-like enzyme
MTGHMSIELSHHLAEGQLDDLMLLYGLTYWAKDRKREEVCKMLDNTDMLFVLTDTDTRKLVGFSRVLTDRVYKVLVLDVIVHPDYRGQGLGRRLLDAITAHPELSGVKHFELYCRDDVNDLYKKWDFSEDLHGQRFMRRDGHRSVQ